jgi:uncharacterized membrane protein
MTRQAFLARLRDGLRGLPPRAVADIMADYEAHFAEGEAHGRSEAEVASALGEPGRLARELRAEVGLRRWEEERNPSAAAAAIFAVLGLGALDILVLLPFLIGVISVLFAFAIVVIVGFFIGAAAFAAGPFTNPPGGPWAALLFGLGTMAGSVSGGAILTLVTIGLVNLLVWYGRLHFRLLKPAIEPEA